MIKLTIPSLSHEGFIFFGGNAFLGPFPLKGDISDSMEYRHFEDTLKERPGMNGENHVVNLQTFADLTLDPISNWTAKGYTSTLRLYRRGDLRSSNIYRKHSILKQGWGRDSSKFFYRPSPTLVYWFDIEGDFYNTNAGGERRHYVRTMQKYEYVSHTKFTGVYTQTSYSNGYGFAKLTTPGRGSTDDYYFGVCKHFLDSDYEENVSSSVITEQRDTYVAMKQHHTIGDASSGFRDLMSLVNSVQDYPVPNPTGVRSFTELVTPAIDTLDRNSVNMFEFFQGLKNPKDLIPKLKNLSKLKTHASNYLAVEYGVLPTIDDLHSILDAINSDRKPYFDRSNYRILTAGHSVSASGTHASVVSTNRIKIAVNSSDPYISKAFEGMRTIGGFPSVDNLWDLVPYSFVIDWFVDIGGFLERVDTSYRTATLGIQYCTMSNTKDVSYKLPYSASSMGISGTISRRYYSRHVQPDVPEQPLNFEVSNELPNHWLEAGALIVANRK